MERKPTNPILVFALLAIGGVAICAWSASRSRHAGAPPDRCEECRTKKQAALRRCQPKCETTDLQGEDFDRCLRECGGEDMKECTPLCR